MPGRRPVIVYQMGKVGSLALRRALRAAGVRPVLHAHNLRPGVQDPLYRLIRERVLERGLPADVVTVVRDPVARSLSAFVNGLPRGTLAAAPDLAERYAAAGDLHRRTLEWFDLQPKAVLGIDVFAHPFPPGAPSLAFEERGHRVLILKLEAPAEERERALGAFLGGIPVRLQPYNATAAKPQGALYRELRASIRLPPAHLDLMLDSRYARHFYSDRERAEMRAYWSQAPR